MITVYAFNGRTFLSAFSQLVVSQTRLISWQQKHNKKHFISIKATKTPCFFLRFQWFALFLQGINTRKIESQTNYKWHIQGSPIALPRRSDIVLDVSRLWFQTGWARYAPRNELDLDAAFLPLWHHGPSVQGMEMATDTRTYGRKAQGIDSHTCHFRFVCRKLSYPPNRRVCPLRSAKAIW